MENKKIKIRSFRGHLLLKEVLSPVIYLLILIILFTALIKLGVGKIITQRRLIKQGKAVENVLNGKVKLLTESKTQLKIYSGLVSFALPEKNSVLTVLTQLKAIQAENSLVISGIRFTIPPQSGASRAMLGVTFNLDGNIFDIGSFLDKLTVMLPVVLINRLEITRSGGVYTVTVKASTFWEDFPKKMPALTDPIAVFDKDDLALLARLQEMKSPVVSRTIPKTPSSRQSPF